MHEEERALETPLDLGRNLVLFMGIEGSGKSTIARRLALESGKPYISTGDIIRHTAHIDQSKYGDECRAMLRGARYLDPDVLMELVARRFSQPDTRNGFVLDGGMRTVKETQGFQGVLERADRIMPITIIHLRMPSWMSFDRLVGQNGRGRNDDTIDAVFNRLSNYYNLLGQRVGFIRQQKDWRIITVNATGSIDQTFKSVKSAILT